MSKKSKKVKKASKSPEVPLRSSDASEVDAAVTSVTATAFTEETFDNRNLNWTAVAELVLAVLITQWEVLRRLFGTVELTLGQWALALVPAVVLVFIWELGKLIARRVTSRAPAQIPAAGRS